MDDPPLVLDVHWIVSMIGLVLIGFAANDFAVVLFGYTTDSYTVYAASGVATLSFTRTIVAAIFPLFITQMYTGMGPNLAMTVFAATATAFAFTPFLFLEYGKALRYKSKYAATMANEYPDDHDDPEKQLEVGARAPTNEEVEKQESHPMGDQLHEQITALLSKQRFRPSTRGS